MALKKSKRLRQPNWRPNFRNVQTLPDIKVVRTDFLLNTITVVVALALLGLIVAREMQIGALRDEVGNYVTLINGQEAENRRFLQQDRDFATISAKLEELRQLEHQPIPLTVLTMDLASSQPEQVILRSLQITPGVEGKGKTRKNTYTISLVGTVVDSPSTPAPQLITDYRNSLASIESIAPLVQSTELARFSRGAGGNQFDFDIRVLIAEPAN